MSHGKTDQELVNGKHNTARFFVQTRQVAWVLLLLTCAWGIYGYISMPQRKDPEVQVRTAVALVPWPGSSAEKVEQLVTKKSKSRWLEIRRSRRSSRSRARASRSFTSSLTRISKRLAKSLTTSSCDLMAFEIFRVALVQSTLLKTSATQPR